MNAEPQQPGYRVDFESALRFAKDLIRIRSMSGEEEEVARRILDEFEALGFEEVHHDGAGNVLGRVPGSEGRAAGGAAPTVMLNAHLDIVAEGDPADWEVPPFAAEVKDGDLHGRGAMDIKGPLAILTHAAAALKGRARGDVLVAHTVYEERGGLGMKYLMEHTLKDDLPDAVIVGESTHGDICIGHRGRAEIEVVLKGEAGHASAPERARNALQLVPAVLRAVDRVAAQQPVDPILGAATLAVTGIDVLPESRNVIPDQVTVVLDWRVLPEMDDERLLATLRRAITESIGGGGMPEGLSWQVQMASEHQRCWTGHAEERPMYMPSFLIGAAHPVAVAAAHAAGRRLPAREGEGAGAPLTSLDAPATIRPWTFATDGGWSCGVHGIPTIGFAPGEERYAHTNRERLDLSEAEWALGRLPEIVLAMQRALEG